MSFISCEFNNCYLIYKMPIPTCFEVIICLEYYQKFYKKKKKKIRLAAVSVNFNNLIFS